MRKVLIILILPLLASWSCQQSPNTEQVKEKLVAINEQERDAYFDRDLESLESVWSHENTSRRLFVNASGVTVLDGWEQIQKNYAYAVGNDERWEKAEDLFADFSNYEVIVYENTALLCHDIQWRGSYDGIPYKARQKRIVHFVKEEMNWKFQLAVQMDDPIANSAANKQSAALYHELNAENVDKLLAGDFIGRSEKDRHTWNKEDHRDYLSNGNYKWDSVYQQVAEGNWVATRFFREMLRNGDTVRFEGMHFKRFEDGKIAEIWEYGDSRQDEY